MSTPARYLNPDVYQALASQFVCGTLRGAARKRFVGLMQRHREIADAVTQWEKQMDGISDGIPQVQPSAQVWGQIDQQLFAEPKSESSTSAFGFLEKWWLSLSGLAASLVFATLLVVQQLEPPVRVNYVAVMEDAAGTAQWVATSSKETRKLRIENVSANFSSGESAGNTMVVWAISKEDGSYYRFGEVQPKERNWIALNDEAWGKIKSAHSLIVTEEADLSIASPSGPVIAKGLCVQLKYDEKKSA